VVKQPYRILQADDAPPYPVFGKGDLARKLSHLGGRAGGEGRISARVWIDEKGVPQSVTLQTAHNKTFGEHIGQALMLIKYLPGRCAGQPCAMAVPFTFNFYME